MLGLQSKTRRPPGRRERERERAAGYNSFHACRSSWIRGWRTPRTSHIHSRLWPHSCHLQGRQTTTQHHCGQVTFLVLIRFDCFPLLLWRRQTDIPSWIEGILLPTRWRISLLHQETKYREKERWLMQLLLRRQPLIPLFLAMSVCGLGLEDGVDDDVVNRHVIPHQNNNIIWNLTSSRPWAGGNK